MTAQTLFCLLNLNFDGKLIFPHVKNEAYSNLLNSIVPLPPEAENLDTLIN